MRVRATALAGWTGLLVLAAGGCSAHVSGAGRLADGATRPPATSSQAPSPTDPPSPAPTTDTPSAPRTPTVDPTAVRERTTCLLVISDVRKTNAAVNKAKARAAVIALLRGGATAIDRSLRTGGLPGSDKVYASGGKVAAALRRLAGAAGSSGRINPASYNQSVKTFGTLCASL